METRLKERILNKDSDVKVESYGEKLERKKMASYTQNSIVSKENLI